MSKALVVDDSKSARFSVKKLLQKFNMEVDLATSAEDALNYLETQIPDVIFMDHLMPGMDGFDATQKIKENHLWKHIPIIMSTSKAGKEYEQRAQDLGVVGILPKPASLQEMNDLLIKADLQNEKSKATLNDSETAKIKEVAIEVVRSVTMQTINETITTSLQQQSNDVHAKSRLHLEELVLKASKNIKEEMQAEVSAMAKNFINGSSSAASDHQFQASVNSQIETLEHSLTESLTTRFTTMCEDTASKLDVFIKAEPEKLEEIKSVAKFVAAHKANEAAEQVAEEIAVRCAEDIAETKANEAVAAALGSFQASLQSNLKNIWLASLAAIGLSLATLGYVLFGN